MKKKTLRKRTLADLRPLVRAGKYRIGSHAVRHAFAEGFTEKDIIGSILYGKELLRYIQDERLLVLGYISVSTEVRIPLHVVLEHKRPRQVDIITAFIPREAHRVMSRGRLAEFLRHDFNEAQVSFVGSK